MVKEYKYLEQAKEKECSSLEYSGENPKDYEINRSSDLVAFFFASHALYGQLYEFLNGTNFMETIERSRGIRKETRFTVIANSLLSS